MNYRLSPLFLTMAIMTPLVQSEEKEQQHEPVPTIEILEFLGEWETDEGEWVDPEDLNNDYYAAMIRETEKLTNE